MGGHIILNFIYAVLTTMVGEGGHWSITTGDGEARAKGGEGRS